VLVSHCGADSSESAEDPSYPALRTMQVQSLLDDSSIASLPEGHNRQEAVSST
jgi:hypothetical protein